MKEIKIHLVLRRLLAKNGITTSALSKATGVPNSTLSTWLLPSARPKDLRHLKAVADYFQVCIEDLLFDEFPPVVLNALRSEAILDGYYRLRLEKVLPPSGDKNNAGSLPKKKI